MSSTESNAKVGTSNEDTLEDTLLGYDIGIAPGRDIEHLHISVPCYYTQTFATKPSKTFLVGMNWLRTAYHFIQNKVKQDYSDLITPKLMASGFKLSGKYEVAYVYYYKSQVSDLLNVGALMSKYFLDAAQKAGTVREDNVQYCVKEAFYVGKQDKENPRVEIYIREVRDDK
jgi:Holliday junction resolvase RusA-like endonuclease